eukprot:3157789-Amphidinium_carterae.2
MIADSGCLLTVAGATWVQQLLSYLASFGITTRSFSQSEFFRFGAGEVQRSTEALLVPVKTPGVERPSLICVSVVETGCPGLLSQRDLGRLQVTLDFGTSQLVIGDWQQSLRDGQHPTVPLIADASAAKELQQCWHDSQWLKQQAEQLGLDEEFVVQLASSPTYWTEMEAASRSNEELTEDSTTDEDPLLKVPGKRSSEYKDTDAESESSHGRGIPRRRVPSSSESDGSECDDSRSSVFYYVPGLSLQGKHLRGIRQKHQVVLTALEEQNEAQQKQRKTEGKGKGEKR